MDRLRVITRDREILMDFGNGTIAATFSEDRAHVALTIEDPNEGEMMGRLLTRSQALDFANALVKLCRSENVHVG